MHVGNGPLKPHAQKDIRELFQVYKPPASGARYLHLAHFVRELIVDGALRLGTRLPSERLVASDLDISRTTVQNAFRELERWGLVQIRPKSGAVVCGLAERENPVMRPRPGFEARLPNVASTFLEDLMESASRARSYPFEVGFADPNLFPLAEFESVVEEIFSRRLHEALNYGPTAGLVTLRQTIAQFLRRHRGLTQIDADDVLITSGSVQALNLIASTFINIGDIVLIENPSFPGAIQLFRNAGATLVDLKVDEHGMQVDDLDQLLSRVHAKVLYVQPTVQNPTGATMSAERRVELLRAADRWGVIVIEDDAYGLLSRTNTPPLLANDRDRSAFYIGTFSKTISSGLRVGYVVANKHMIRSLAMTKQLSDLHTSNISQLLIEGWLATGDISAHLTKSREEYSRRITAALKEITGGDVLEPYITPTEGFYVYCRVLGGVSAARVRRSSLDVDVTFALGDFFSPRDDHRDYLRLCVSALDVRGVRTGIRRLSQAIRDSSPV